MKSGSKLVSGLLLTATLALSATANATILTFTDRDAFNAAVGAVDLIDFEQFSYAGVCPRSPVGGPPCSLTVGDVTFTGRAESYVGAEFESGLQLVTIARGRPEPVDRSHLVVHSVSARRFHGRLRAARRSASI